MEYVQERIGTFHDYDSVSPSAPVDRTTVVVPLTQRDYASPAARRVFATLEELEPAQVLVPLRADQTRVDVVCQWLESFELPLQVLWCTAPPVESFLTAQGLDGQAGKGRDVWLALGVASDTEYVVVHDADATTYDITHVPRLLFPLAEGYEFVKGYYARIEDNQLYGRLYRLFYTPLIRALADEHDADLLSYLASFRYALAGEFALTGTLARKLRAPRGWGLEVGTLGDAFDAAGFTGTAQVDLGVHEHEHRSVTGTDGLGEMARQVGATLYNVLEEHGIEPDYDSLPGRYRDAASALIEQYATDAAFNELDYDREAEHEQVDRYAETIEAPIADGRLPAWDEIDLDPGRITALSASELQNVRVSVSRSSTDD